MRISAFPLIIASSLVFLISDSAYLPAQEAQMCTTVATRGEGHWPIGEENFTKAEALRAINALSIQVSEEDTTVDFVSAENGLVLVKGFLLKTYAANDEGYVEKFCDFIRDEAYVRH